MSLVAYRDKFLSKMNLASTTRNGKMTYVDEKYWRLIKEICNQTSEPTMTIAGYINNVLMEHFETYKKDVANHIRDSHDSLTEDLNNL